ncbi:MAG: CPBP family glutamic-type intramembrane protease, partial [Candidatus Zixiibacteriota bacterium]
LGVKNIYGCFPRTDKVCRYHIRNEVPDVTARSIRNFPVHFSFVDAWIGSDGFQGYKIAHPRQLNMLFGGNNAVAVDMEIFERAGLNPRKSKILRKAVGQLYDGVYPEYVVEGDKSTRFDQLVTWENINDDVVESIDVLEEVYIAMALINVKTAADVVDYNLFPPKNIFYRFLVWITKKTYSVFKLFRFVNTLFKAPEKMRLIEEGQFSLLNIGHIIGATLRKLTDRASIILWSSFLLLMLWGFHGDMAILTALFGESWTQKITLNLSWGTELVSFVIGFLLVVVIPCAIIKLGFKSNIRDFGLGLPAKDQRQKAKVVFFALLGITSVFVFIASFNPGMQQEYPLFTRALEGGAARTIPGWWEFVIYELVYLLFFITIEFAFRGYLLFGLNSIRTTHKAENGSEISIQRFGIYAILIQMLAYTTWHYGKPVPEMIGTVIWGVCVAAIALRIGSIWPIIIPHWLYNVFLDLLIWKQLNRKILSIFGG